MDEFSLFSKSSIGANARPQNLGLEFFVRSQSDKNIEKVVKMGMIEDREKKISQEIDSIVRQIIRKYHPIKIILFGSAARGDFWKINDLDFLIIKDNVLQFGIDRMRELDEIIEKDMAADMLVYRSDEFDERVALGDPFIKSILKEGRVLYG